jgi:hypothetical protein
MNFNLNNIFTEHQRRIWHVRGVHQPQEDHGASRRRGLIKSGIENVTYSSVL